MRITETVIKEVEVTKDILCNLCGESCRVEGGGLSCYGLIEAQVSGGYASPILEDYSSYTFSLCEPCLAGVFSNFKLEPTKGDYI